MATAENQSLYNLYDVYKRADSVLGQDDSKVTCTLRELYEFAHQVQLDTVKAAEAKSGPQDVGDAYVTGEFRRD